MHVKDLYSLTFKKENYSIKVPTNNSHIVMTGREVAQCIEIIPLTAELEAFLDKMFFANTNATGFDVVCAVIAEVTWKKFLADEEKRKKRAGLDGGRRVSS